MMALNARTGKVDPGFGNEGEVPLVVPYDGAHHLLKTCCWSAPTFMDPGSATSAPITGGRTDSRSARLRRPHRQRVWTFHTFPHPGEVGNNTWAARTSWKEPHR